MFWSFAKKTLRWLWPSLIVIAASCIRKSYFLSLSSEQIGNGLLLYAAYLSLAIPAGHLLSKSRRFEDESKTALVILFITYFFFEYSTIFSTWGNFARDIVEEYIFNKQHTVFILLSILIGAAFILIISKVDDYIKNRFFLIFITIVFTVMPFFDVLFIPDYKFESDLFDIAVDTSKIKEKDIPEKIFWIILDEHPSSLVLDEVWGYKDTVFRKELESLGFTAYDSCVSNYNYTPFSIASTAYGAMLNINEPISVNARQQDEIGLMIKQSPVMNIFKYLGYRFCNYSFWEDGFKEYFADKGTIINSSVAGVIFEKFSIQDAYSKVLYNRMIIDSLKNVLYSFSENCERIFVYAHIYMPHAPFLRLDVDSDQIIMKSLSHENDPAFLGHIRYTDSLIVGLLKKWFDKLNISQRSKILILLQSDHGPRYIQKSDKRLRWRSSFGVLNAVHWHGDLSGKYYNGMSNVNTFRILIRDMLGVDIETIKDTSINVCPYFRSEIE
ncbi:MAG: hypothetical protein JXA06_02940 [Bacteroidetes bacterium]|nr:hypothetical protein [Bacteroidota bacterium]